MLATRLSAMGHFHFGSMRIAQHEKVSLSRHKELTSDETIKVRKDLKAPILP